MKIKSILAKSVMRRIKEERGMGDCVRTCPILMQRCIDNVIGVGIVFNSNTPLVTALRKLMTEKYGNPYGELIRLLN